MKSIYYWINKGKERLVYDSGSETFPLGHALIHLSAHFVVSVMNSLKCVFSRFVPNILDLRPCLLRARPIINALIIIN